MEIKIRTVVTSGRRELAVNGHEGTFLNDNSVCLVWVLVTQLYMLVKRHYSCNTYTKNNH